MSMNIPTITKELYYTGQLLGTDDFVTEQNFHIQEREFLTQTLYSAGVLSGLEVSSPSGKTIQITQGAAIGTDGSQVLLSGSVTFNGSQVDVGSGVFSIDLTSQATGTWQLTVSTSYFKKANNESVNSPEVQLTASGSSLNDNQVHLADLTITDSAITVTNKSTSVQVQPSRIPTTNVKNLDASVITSGVFAVQRIPDINKLSGTLASSQLPFWNQFDQLTFSSGVVSGLSLSESGTNVLVTAGVAIDASSNKIALVDKANYNGVQISLVGTNFELDTSSLTAANAPWIVSIAFNSSDQNIPTLSINTSGSVPSGAVALGELTQLSPLKTTTDQRQSVTLNSSLLPTITADELPTIQQLNGVLVPTQIPDLSADKLPKLQDLNGTLKASQLPADITPQKPYITFYADQPIINSGGSVTFSWSTNKEVDNLSLTYLDGTTIKTLTTSDSGIQLTESNYKVSPTVNTTYTLTASKEGVTVDQKQLFITVIGSTESIGDYLKGLKSSGTKLTDAISSAAQKFSLQTYSQENAKTIVGALNGASYDAMSSVSDVATYYSQSTNWSLMVDLAKSIGAPQPSIVTSYIQSLSPPVPSYLQNDNFDFTTYCSQMLESVADPTGSKFIDVNLSSYAIYCFASGIFNSRSNPTTVGSWGRVISTIVLDYYKTTKSIPVSNIPTSFPSILTAATS